MNEILISMYFKLVQAERIGLEKVPIHLQEAVRLKLEETKGE